MIVGCEVVNDFGRKFLDLFQRVWITQVGFDHLNVAPD